MRDEVSARMRAARYAGLFCFGWVLGDVISLVASFFWSGH